MNIILDYQPIEPKASLRFNGIASSELFGPLGNVRGYPIQSWLFQRGAWPGLSKVLSDLSRGRNIEITFVGRMLDFQDVQQSLVGLKNIKMTFQNAYELSDSIYDLSETKQMLDEIPNRYLKRKLCSLLEMQLPERCWHIDSVEAYRTHQKQLMNSRIVVLLPSGLFRVIQKEMMAQLCEHFMRPCESIVVLAQSSQEQSMLLEEWKRIGVSICTENDPLIERLIEKYSLAELTGIRLAAQHRFARELSQLNAYFESLREENEHLRITNQSEDISADQEMKYEKNLAELRWYRQYQDQLDKLIHNLSPNSAMCVMKGEEQ